MKVASLIAIGVLALVPWACKSAAADCNVDGDCSNGSRCSDDGKCIAIDPSDGGASGEGGVIATTCSAPTTSCSVDTDCCSGRCARGRCSSGTGTGSSSSSSSSSSSGSTSSSSGGPACKDVYELCVGDECCSGLSCTNGTCR